MPKIRILSVKQIKLNTSQLVHVKLPEAGFSAILNIDNAQEAALKDKKLRKAVEDTAQKEYNKFLLQTAKRLQKFDKLFIGMLAKGAAPAAVAKQVTNLKQAIEKEVPKWEKAAEQEVMAAFKKLAAKKR